MLILRDKSLLPPECSGSVIALGNFDGLHLGHMQVIQAAIAQAKKTGKPSALLTFEPHPRRVFRPDLPPMRIMSLAEKGRILREMGVDFTRVIRFTRAFSQTTAEQFVKDILVKQLRISHLVTGDNFIFGHNRGGNAEYLEKMAKSEGFGYTKCPQFMIGGERCSSTRVRDLMQQGKVEEVATLLGRPYRITAIVRGGDKRGRTLGFPTANLLPGRIFTPANGVYAVRAIIRGEQVNGVANLGVRPTFDGKRLQLEVHLFDWNQDIYSEHMEVVFVKQLRGEKKFDGIDALKAQIAKDCETAQAILALPYPRASLL